MADTDHTERSNGRTKAAAIKAGNTAGWAATQLVHPTGVTWAEVATWHVLDTAGGFYREHGRLDCNSGATGPSRRV